MTWGTQTRALRQLEGWDGVVGWCGGREGGSREREYMYTYDWSMLMYGKNQHHIVIILQLKLNKLRENDILKKWKRNAGSIPLRYGDQGWCDIPGTLVGLGPKAAASWVWGSPLGAWWSSHLQPPCLGSPHLQMTSLSAEWCCRNWDMSRGWKVRGKMSWNTRILRCFFWNVLL